MGLSGCDVGCTDQQPVVLELRQAGVLKHLEEAFGVDLPVSLGVHARHAGGQRFGAELTDSGESFRGVPRHPPLSQRHRNQRPDPAGGWLRRCAVQRPRPPHPGLMILLGPGRAGGLRPHGQRQYRGG